MTLVVCWKSKDKLSCVSDTRISNSGATISDAGGKVFIVPVTLRVFGDNVVQRKYSTTVGFAFCGSTLLANNTHVIASNCTQLLRKDSPGGLPSVEDIANIYAKASEYVTKETNGRLNNPILFQGLIFGYCTVKEKYSVFLLTPQVSARSFYVECKEIELEEGQAIPIGSGKDEFIRLSSIPNSAGNARGIYEIFTQIVEEGKVSDVGGYLQIAEATEEGVNIVPVLTQSKENLDQATLLINGFEINELKLPDGYAVGLTAVGIGVEKIAGRSALRAKGIDPDSDEVTQKLQNLASFESCLSYAYKHSQKVNVNDNFTLDVNSPIQGEWYFSSKCKKCNKSTPLFLDPSYGKMGNPFFGSGIIQTQCFRCNSKIEKKAIGLHSKKWKGT